MKLNTNKVLFLFSLVTVFLLSYKHVAATDYKNRLSILPFENPGGWTAPYNPGGLITKILKQSIILKNNFHISPSFSRPDSGKIKTAGMQKMKKPGHMHLPRNQINHPAQFILKGRVLNFTPGKPPSRAQLIFNIGDAIKQKAEVEVELELINHHMGKTLDKKNFKIVSSAGSSLFDLDASEVDLDSMQFQKSSIGKALLDLNKQMNVFIMATLYPLPLEGEVIAVNAKRNEVIINVGQIHGISFGEFFTVYSVTLQYKDPLSQIDLGNKFMRRGVIRVKYVQESLSIASIIAGEGYEMGELVRSRKTNPVWMGLDPSPISSIIRF